MKKYITLFLGYWIVFQVYTYIVLKIAWTLVWILLLIVWLIATAIWASLIDFSNFTLSNMSLISIIFNLILLVWIYALFYIVLKLVSDWTFKWNVKSWYFTKKTINMDLIYSTLFLSIISLSLWIMYTINDWNYYNIIFALFYVISFFIVNKLRAKKEFNTNK